MSKLDDALKKIEKQFGKGLITNLEEDLLLDIESVSTGHLKIDEALGKGIPLGRVIEVYGGESSGKTTLCFSIVKEFQGLGKKVAYLDSEHAFDKKYAKTCGVNLKDLIFSQPDYAEQALTIIEDLIDSEEVDLIILDSVASTCPKVELEGDAGQSHMGVMARLMSQALRRLTGKIAKTKTTVIFINQTRSKIGVMFGSPVTTTGGNALKFYASIRMQLNRIGTNKKGDEVLASQVKVKTVKNKVYPPYKEAIFDIYYDSGVCPLSGLINIALERGILEKRGAWFSLLGDNVAQGLENLRQKCKDEPEFLQQIKDEIDNQTEVIPVKKGKKKKNG